MDATQLYRMLVFANVVDKGSFTQAALALDISRSMVSQHIKKLEQTIGVTLLKRTTRSVQPTDSGRHYFQYCNELLHLAKQAQQAVIPDDTTLAGSIKFAMPRDLGRQLVLPHIGEFHRRYPQIKLTLLMEDNRLNMDEHHIDLVLYMGQARQQAQHKSQQWQTLKLSDYQEVIVASESYLKQHGQISHPDLLTRHQWLSFGSNQLPKPLRLTNQHNDHFDIRVKANISCNSGQAILQLACQGLGLACIATPLAQPYLDQQVLKRVLPDYQLQHGGIYLSHNHNDTLPPRIRALAAFLSEQVFKKRLQL
ncbi:LysR family transcriptional regulator [Shewanella sp. NIFS-20-20]|uniref:LysR family transcriptional regulator n=1 Tax=Shewanella sp. NIFS-20-20 TaxID=2853806 RepID=UPI001C48FB21|nr:LysR family transcriptional regulator [Shewanella sp. NIFS-20-20]MBV7316022.1 LysR family transcriptional regulator [Shewanella sp. NIFS-20-20]